MSTRKGFTLLEILMGTALTALLLTLVVWAIVPTMRAARRGTLQVSLQQSASMVLSRLSADLGRTAWGGLGLGNGSLSVHPLSQVASDGQQVWADTVVVYWLDGDRVGRKTVRPNPGGHPNFKTRAPYLPAPSQLADLVASQAVESRWLGSDVRVFEVAAVPASAEIARTLRLRLVLEGRVAGREDPEQVELVKTLMLRNQTL